MHNKCSCNDKQIIKYRRINKEIPALIKKDSLNAGYDLFANLPSPIVIMPGEVTRINLNVATEIPEGLVGLVFQRSSTYSKWGVKLTNNVGVIDSSYRGNQDVWLAEFKNETEEPVTINPGDKLCQAIFLSLPSIMLEEVDSLSNRNRGGFGTSGTSMYNL